MPKTRNGGTLGAHAAPVSREPTDEEIIRLIASIDHFHGNELKDRTKEHVAAEVAAIKRFLRE